VATAPVGKIQSHSRAMEYFDVSGMVEQ